MMQLTLTPDDPRPLYAQIAAAIREQITNGDLPVGSRLPSGRDLATALGVNLTTVQHAYRTLAEQGFVASRVGRGTTVTNQAPTNHTTITRKIDELVATAHDLGIPQDHITQLLQTRWKAPASA